MLNSITDKLHHLRETLKVIGGLERGDLGTKKG